MSLKNVKRALQKVPPLFHVARAVQSAGRTVLGPAWLRRQVRQQTARRGPLRIVVGSSHVFDDGWIPTNVQYLNLLIDEHWQHAFRDHPIDTVLAEHVWEHLSPADGRAAAVNCYRYLKPGGRLRIAVPDGHHPDPEYIEFVRPGGSGPGASDHHTLYTCESICDMLSSVGFNVDLLEYYDADGKFHAAQWDQADGRVHRCANWTETLADGRKMSYSSLIVDGRKPTA